ncbi:MAG: trypsin-like peptidase domain-containing protein [Treponema sp.]|nr:trypsin-like peptidase domain-containing protein [Treponema sp.]MCL2237428.1 trypsin-like peptidase domain-containing protein [Treponema sp.]
MKKITIAIILTVLIIGCESLNNTVEERPFRTTSAIRISDIERLIEDRPVVALNLIYTYKEIYSGTEEERAVDWQRIAELERQASANLVSLQQRAIDEQRWDDAISIGRSLANIGVRNANTGREGAFTLLYAKKKLEEGDNLSAFLAAVKAHEMQPLDAQSALLFLEKAVQARQRRSSAFFLAAAQAAGARNIPAALREYASGRDTFSNMVNGVATVIVDMGYRSERGMIVPDRSLGSAFFVDSSGLLITNYHVIASEVDPKHRGPSRMFIRMGDASSPRIPARVVGWDKALDLALIKTEIETDYVFSLVDRVIPRVGDSVLAIGSPGGLQRTVTSGIVSALGRRFMQIGDVIQIDAAVNPGNSGGPLIDSEGRFVGVIFAGIPQYQGINFAVPAEMVAAALPAMIKGGRAQRPWLGLTLCETLTGAEIIYTAPNTPAFSHRIREGFFIKSINGKAVTAPQGGIISAMQKALFLCGPNELIAIETAGSDGETKRSVMMTTARPDLPLLEAARIDRRERMAAPLFGMILMPVQTSLFSPGFRVDRVIRGSIADEAGISENDPVSLGRLRIMEPEGIAVLEISVKKRRMGYLDTNMMLPVWLDSPNTL